MKIREEVPEWNQRKFSSKKDNLPEKFKIERRIFRKARGEKEKSDVRWANEKTERKIYPRITRRSIMKNDL